MRPGTVQDICTHIIALGAQATVLHGVLCLGREQPRDGEHPALRRRLAHLPVGHLVTTDIDGQLLVSVIRAQIAPWWWDQSGAAIFFHVERKTLMIAADPETLHAVVDLLDRIDLLGFDQACNQLKR